MERTTICNPCCEDDFDFIALFFQFYLFPLTTKLIFSHAQANLSEEEFVREAKTAPLLVAE